MKTMTCKDLGGPCELALHGASADEIIKAQDRHLKDSVKGGDASHEGALRDMKGRWKRPKQSMDWYSAMKNAYAERPEE
jgi:predicted small metal-binding protein